ncbi:MAG: prepilin-type N-terminal cleavage/methylation domain-containing protein, partial [Candidatus Atribacteria bacterium]|nr:prepilin-type N-terminal cleavage/methylation domain-containing protein [Candidatus Atribacteria bacterium]
MTSCKSSNRSSGFTLLETIITIGVLSFLTLVMYATIVSLGYRMRLELSSGGSYLKPGSKSELNQQIIVDGVNRLLLEVSRNIRNASKVDIKTGELSLQFPDGSTLKYSLNSDGTIVRSKGTQRSIMVEGVDEFNVSNDANNSNLITIEIKVSMKEKGNKTFYRTFQ